MTDLRQRTLDDQTRGEQLRRIDAAAPALADVDLVAALRVLDGVTRGYPNGRPPTHFVVGELMGLPVHSRPHAYRRAAKAVRGLVDLGIVIEKIDGERRIEDSHRPDRVKREHETVFHWKIDFGRLLEITEQHAAPDAPIMQDDAPIVHQAAQSMQDDARSAHAPYLCAKKRIKAQKGDSTSKPDVKFDPLSIELPGVLDTPEFRDAWREWIAYRREEKCSVKSRCLNAQVKALARHGPVVAVEMILQSIANGWKGLFPPKPETSRGADKYAALRDWASDDKSYPEENQR